MDRIGQISPALSASRPRRRQPFLTVVGSHFFLKTTALLYFLSSRYIYTYILLPFLVVVVVVVVVFAVSFLLGPLLDLLNELDKQ